MSRKLNPQQTTKLLNLYSRYCKFKGLYQKYCKEKTNNLFQDNEQERIELETILLQLENKLRNIGGSANKDEIL